MQINMQDWKLRNIKNLGFMSESFKRKEAKRLLKSSQTPYLIMEHKERNIGKKFQPCIFCRSRENLL